MIGTISLIAAVVLPMWNLPLVIRVIKRKSSADISLAWALGVWSCLLLMLPSGIISEDIVFKAFTISNFILFSCTVAVVIRYHKGPNEK